MIDIKDNINILKGVGEKTLAKFNDANIFLIKDLLLYSPKKYDILDVLEPNLQTDGLDFVIDGYISSQIISRKIRNSVDNIIFYFQTKTTNVKVLAYGRGYLRFSLKKGMSLKIFGTYKASNNSLRLKKLFLMIKKV